MSSIKSSISDVVASPDWEEFPEDLRKTVKEISNESQAHLCNCRGNLQVLGVAQSLDSDFGPLIQIQQLMMTDDRIRHTPIIISGPAGCGKSTLLSQVFMYCMEWLGTDVIRIVRLIGQSPGSNYTSELLRNLCLHISLVFDFDISPKHHSYELGKLSIWFQDLLKLVERTTSDLVILLDDLHELKCPPSNQSSILGWLPWNLPSNVHIVCTISEEADSVLRLLKPRISTGDNFVQISPLNAQSALSMLHSNLRDSKYNLTNEQWDIIKECFSTMSVCPLYVIMLSKYIKKWPSWKGIMKEQVPSNLQELVIRILIDMEDSYGVALITKVATYLTCTTYGLREAEIVELLSSMDDDSFSPSYWLSIKSSFMVLLKEYYVGGRPYLQWSHRAIAENVRKRYLSRPEDRYSCHNDLAQAFHLGYLAEKDKKEQSVSGTTKSKDDQSDILRELDELWFHLLQCGDLQKLKQDAICNFDFLFSATKGSSISYVRSILELVRCKFLDWEVELLYTLTKQSVDVLSQDPQQLATEIMNWLKPYADKSSPVLEGLVSNALEWCNNIKNPLLVPKNSWLSLTLPSQVTVMTCPHPIDHMVTTPDSQHLFCSHGRDIHMYHIPSKESVRSLTGHKDEITCIHMTVSGRWLVSGSEDTNVIVWEACSGKMKQRLSHHIAGVLCVTTTNSETLILSGSEVGVVIVARLDTGQLVQRLENHRGVINCIAVNNGDDIFATGSSDCTVCISSLEDFSLLNTIYLTSSICLMDISNDSTFLLLNCKDNTVHVRSLTTGSDVHCLQGYTGSVTRLCFAKDSCRCGVGTSDGKCYIYDIHSATLLQTLIGHSDPISGMQAQENDRFLISSAGIKIVVWNFSPRKKDTPIHHLKTKLRKVDSHSEPVSCVTVSRDGVFAVTGSKDCQVKVWHLNTGEIHTTLEGHCAAVTCVAFSPNGLFVVSGSEDTTLRVWGLAVGLVISSFKEHQTKVTAVVVSFDSRRILSADVQGYHRFWMADSGEQLYACIKPSAQLYLHANIVFAVSGKNENSLKFWPVCDVGAEKTVSHSDAILCYTVTHNCQTIITGSQDMSLKVWEVATGKITQVLVGHDGAVQCVAVAPYCPTMVVSGSVDCSLIIWDMMTGADNLTLRGHTETVKCVKLTLDGSVAVSGADDNTLQLWNTTNGQRIAMLDLHVAMITMVTSVNVSDIVVQLVNQQQLSILSLHNNPAKGLTLEPPTCLSMSEETKLTGIPARGVLPKRVLLRGNLKREQSFDSLYWDLRSNTPRLEPSTGLDDFKRSLMGSREQLSHVGVWDGSLGRVRSMQPEGLPLQPKAKLPKHKLLKKQQSMFAFFPEFSSQPKSIVQTPKMELESKQELSRTPETVHECPSRSESSEEVDNPESHVDRKSASVKDSSICRIV
ncbi:NACHT domain- and WD repeat-containing protein 1-like [Centruroides sculpturatus]|uniref:NACHT domain- and WD repeat-containing protein 1-like n=1 Tax=Centruroides sculpturatus TaxID=218467 RepID=UPI000C6DDCD3|nr:NACHT domain- and WD repeat-containing protein 1-like [Centruroides sculpturatus]